MQVYKNIKVNQTYSDDDFGDIVGNENEIDVVRNANVKIGGVGATYDTITKLSALLNVPELNIEKFLVKDDNVFAKINLNGWLSANAFLNNLDLTYFIFKDNVINIDGVSTFKGCNNLKKVTLVRNELQTELYYGCHNLILQSEQLKNVTRLYLDTFRGMLAQEILDLPKVTNLGARTFKSVTAVVNLDKYNTTTWAVFDGFKGTVNLPSLTNLGAPNVDSTLFQGIHSDATVNLPIVHQTSNGGGVDADVQYLLDNGVTVNYITDAVDVTKIYIEPNTNKIKVRL